MFLVYVSLIMLLICFLMKNVLRVTCQSYWIENMQHFEFDILILHTYPCEFSNEGRDYAAKGKGAKGVILCF